MSDRCELCGAKVREEDETCRECGAVLSAAESDTVREITEVESSAVLDDSIPPPAETNPHLRFEDPPRRRGPLFALVGAATLVGGGVLAFGLLGGDEPPTTPTEAPIVADPPAATPTPPAAAREDDDTCAGLASLRGAWTFTTEVTGSRVVQSSGLNGFYTLEVEVSGCSATATLTKTGYTARQYTENRVQHATAALRLDSLGFATAAFDLQSEVGNHGTTEFSFVAAGDTLSGTYRQRGARWENGGLFGFLHGTKGEASQRELVAKEEPCLTRCSLACGTAVRDVAADALRECIDTCEEDVDAPARCGDVQDLPLAYTLSLQGPDRLSTLCKKIGGCAKKVARTAVPTLGGERLPTGWSEATMVRSRKEGGVRLAFQHRAGWWMSEPLFDAPAGVRVGKLRLYARQLSEEGRRYVLGLARTNASADADEAYVACRLDEDTPSCVRVKKAHASLVNALPEGNLSVGEGAAEPVGVFGW